MLCDQVREHLSAYLDKELTAELSAAVRAHLDTCAACRTLADELRATADLLGRLPVRGAPEHLAADVIREIERRGIVPAGAPVEGQPQERTLPMRRARLWPRALAVAATVLLAVGIGVLAYLSETAKMPRAPTPAYEVAALPAKHAAAPDPFATDLADKGNARWDEVAEQNRRMSGNRTEPDLGADFKAKKDHGGLTGPGQLAAGRGTAGGDGYLYYDNQLADRSMAWGYGAARKEGLDAAPSVNLSGGSVVVRDGDTRRRLGGDELATRGTVVAQAAGGAKELTLDDSALGYKIAPDAAKTGQVAAGQTLSLGTTIAGVRVEQQAEVPLPAQQTWAIAHGAPAAKESDAATLMARARPAEPAAEAPAPPPAAPPLAAPARAPLVEGKFVVEKPAVAPAPAALPEVLARPVALPEVVAKPAEPPAVAAKPAAPLSRDESKTDLRPPAVTTVPAVRFTEEAAKVAPAGPTVLAEMMDDVADGRIAADQLARVATRDNLQAADNQLIIRADSPDEADRRLVQLFMATGWRPLAPTGERERSVSRLEVLQDKGAEPQKPPAAVSAGAASLPPAEKGQPPAGPGAPGGVYWQVSHNGEQVWVVLADRDSLSRFGSRLAQVQGMDVDADSSTEFQAIARLQQELKQSLGRQAVAADTEGLNAEARKAEAGRGGQPAAGLSSKVAMGKAGEDTAHEDLAVRDKDAKQEAWGSRGRGGSAWAPSAAPAAPAPADKAAGRFGQQSGGGAGGAAAATAAQRPHAPQPSRGAYYGTLEGGAADALRTPGAPQAAARMKAAEKSSEAAETTDFFDTLAARNAPSPPANAVLLVIRVQSSGAHRAAGEAPAAVPAAEPRGKTSP
ncbi:MAG: zf-HC2 domain-containing protein [Planctomycetes bacterium]|nr:zf-HC2 domain-containing protein [Planctomycetota bacterium]